MSGAGQQSKPEVEDVMVSNTEEVSDMPTLRNSGVFRSADNNASNTQRSRQQSGEMLFQQSSIIKVRDRARALQGEFLQQMDVQLTDMIDDFMSELELSILPAEYRSFSGKSGSLQPEDSHKRKTVQDGCLPSKEFVSCRSLLTELFEVNHIRTIYHIFIAILILLFLNTVLYDLLDTGKLNLEFELMQWAFGQVRIVVTIWLLMKLSTVMVLYPAFHCWAHNRVTIKPGRTKHLWDCGWLALLLIYQCAFIYLPVKSQQQNCLPFASSTIILMEQVRLIMKAHAFVRSNIPRALAYKPHQDDSRSEDWTPCPDFSKFLYFIFAPTLIYRDSYPRTSTIRWKWVLLNFMQVIGCTFYLYFLFVRFCVPVFRKFGSAQDFFTPKTLLLSVFSCMLPGTLILLCGFFALLHSWLNAFAEMLRFADRLFYKDWWNSSSYASYYRTWNVVVHDWLYTYIYKDIHDLLGFNSKVIPMLLVFFLSSLFHEYIITFTLGFFYPILFLMFGGFGVLFVFVTKHGSAGGNIFMWVTIFMGTGLLLCLYSMEWYARINCPPAYDSVIDFFIPRSWTCNAIRREVEI